MKTAVNSSAIQAICLLSCLAYLALLAKHIEACNGGNGMNLGDEDSLPDDQEKENQIIF